MRTLNEQISRIKQIMNINENEGEGGMMALLQQDTEAFNQEADEDLTVEEYREMSCQAQSEFEPGMESEVTGNLDQEGKSKLAQIIEKMKRATPEQLKEEKRKLKQALASKNATDMQEQGFLTIMVFGVPLGWALFLAVAAYILASFIHYMIKSFLNRNPNRRRNCTDPIL